MDVQQDKFILFKNELKPIHTLSLVQSKQLIDIIQYLYDCHVIHRDIRPQNLMLNSDLQQLKLIDFGFAVIYEFNETTRELPLAGTTTYAGYEFLNFYSRLSLNSLCSVIYHYERTFDLKCALNIIMFMNDDAIKSKINSIEILPSIQQKALEAFKFWDYVKENNENYSNLLKLINNLNKSSDFDELKDKLEKLVHC